MTQMSTQARAAVERPVRGLASLRTRLILSTAAIAAVAVAILGYYVYTRLQQSNAFLVGQLDSNVRQQAQVTMNATGTTQAASLNTFFLGFTLRIEPASLVFRSRTRSQ